MVRLNTSVKFNCRRRIEDIIVEQEGSLLVEMQQRATEFNSIVDRHTDIRLVMKSLVCLVLNLLLV